MLDDDFEVIMIRGWSLNWWSIFLRGIAAIIFGLLVFFWPSPSVSVFVILVGAFLIVDGIFVLLHGFMVRDRRWWARLIHGIIAIGLGIAVLLWQGLTALTLLYIFALYLIIVGIVSIIMSIEFRKIIEGKLLLIVMGVLALVVGVLLILHPMDGILALAQAIGVLSIVFGVLMVIMGMYLRRMISKATKID
jgi:uncharacterized membrane protein HdeD (DUF308 family)